MKKTRVAIMGATGYTALETMVLLLRHPYAEITALTTRSDENLHVRQVHPQMTGRIDLHLENLSLEQIAERADCVFSCLPHKASAERIPGLLELGVKVVDLSADYRLDDPAVFEQWYGVKHPDAARLGHVPYGLPELFRKDIVGANLVANPGCYPTTAIVALSPLLKNGLIEPFGILIDSKSGASGAGKGLKPHLLYCELNEGFSAYGVGTHRHQPEIEQVLSKMAGGRVDVLFTPHLVPMERGILTTAYSLPTRPVTQDEILACMRAFYQNEPFIRVVDHLPNTRECRFTNYVNVTARVVKDRIITVSCIDNLVKGASGAAVQNFNILFGYPEETGLL
ncbi:MAG: N-acetyl-gamma-glutamyl-phosphate reductase [Planctomycetia bacterium]|nr:N-acetyl-gamma-glutamyl-phosphate reductase [Planctomycetia bacterium]